MYKDVFCFKIGMFSVKNNLGWVMNRTDDLYSCVATFQGNSYELLILVVFQHSNKYIMLVSLSS